MSAVKADLAKIALTQPVCTEVGEKIALSRRVEKHWRYVHTHTHTLRGSGCLSKGNCCFIVKFFLFWNHWLTNLLIFLEELH